MAHVEIPLDLNEEILSRVSPLTLIRFRAVSKQWNDLLNDKTFINNHKATFRFILSTKSKIYSVSINPKIEVRELILDDITGLNSKIPSKLVDCNEFLLCSMDQGTLIWNPWLRQTKLIKVEADQPKLEVRGLVYDDDSDGSGYKTLSTYLIKTSNPTKTCWKVGHFESDVWESNELESHGSSSTTTTQAGEENRPVLRCPSVSLDGSLFWIASFKNGSIFGVLYFDFSTENFYRFCDLPCGGDNHENGAFVLRVFKEDRFSLLKQCSVSKKIEIWVTKNKIRKCYGKDVNIIEVSVPNLPYLQNRFLSTATPSYFVDDKRLVVCSCDKNGQTWIYVFGDKMLISKTKLDLGVDSWPLHCTYFPSLVSVPRGQREEKESDV